MSWIDAPVSEWVGGAENGTLAIMAGGPVEALDRARPLEALREPSPILARSRDRVRWQSGQPGAGGVQRAGGLRSTAPGSGSRSRSCHDIGGGRRWGSGLLDVVEPGPPDDRP